MFKVLIADDEHLIREGLAQYIPWGQYGMEVVGVAENGQHALELLHNCACDILVSDIRMPGMDGFRLVEELMESGMTPWVILISSYDDFDYAQRAIKLRVIRDYILKPIDTDQFCQMLERVQSELQKSLTPAAGEQILQKEYMAFMKAMKDADYDRNKLSNLVGAGNTEEARRLWKGSWDIVEQGHFSIEVLQRFCGGVIMSAAVTRLSSSQGVEALEYDPIRPVYLTTSRQELFAYVDEFIAQCCHANRQMLEKSYSPQVTKALEKIDETYNDPDLSLTKLAALLNMTPNHLSVKFKAETGVGFMKYLTEKRMEQAKHLLKDVSYRVYEVSALVGFEDEKYFTRQFKNYTGITPREYRDKTYIQQ